MNYEACWKRITRAKLAGPRGGGSGSEPRTPPPRRNQLGAAVLFPNVLNGVFPGGRDAGWRLVAKSRELSWL